MLARFDRPLPLFTAVDSADLFFVLSLSLSPFSLFFLLFRSRQREENVTIRSRLHPTHHFHPDGRAYITKRQENKVGPSKLGVEKQKQKQKQRRRRRKRKWMDGWTDKWILTDRSRPSDDQTKHEVYSTDHCHPGPC